MSAYSDSRRLDRLERAVGLILAILMEEQLELTKIEEHLKQHWSYPQTSRINVTQKN